MPSVGKSIPHDAALGHVTGQAPYIDDLRPLAGELVVGFVGSPIAAGKLLGIDTAVARATPGVVGCYTSSDVPGHNMFGVVVFDEPFLADGELLYLGQPVVVIAAESQNALERARQAVRIEFEAAEPLLELKESIRRQNFIGPTRRIARGDVGAELAASVHRLNGEFTSGGQEQFYLESQAAIAYPREQGQVLVHSSTQNPTEIQALVAEMLGVGQHEVVCECKRMGGAFGGKESQAAIPAMMAALVARKTGRSARVVYSKDDDMRVTGKRHEYFSRWDVGFDDAGRIQALRIEYYSNGGISTDLSLAVMERTLLHTDNCYFLPTVELTGQVCFTNLPSNTAFRGFGGPQALVVIENILETIAERLGLDAFDVRMRNLYGVGERNVTPYGQLFDRNHLPEIFATLAAKSQYRKWRADVERFNETSPTHVRGLAMTGVKFGISFTTKFLNQGNALVNVYTDGTVQVSTGATEMGQGVNVKIRQLVADEFGIDIARVTVMSTTTEKNINTSPTAASSGTDLNGAAAVKACRDIKRRLRQFAAGRLADAEAGISPSASHIQFRDGKVRDSRRPDKTIPFGQLCAEARRERVDLGARGFYATPGVDFNRETGQGTPFFYFTQGAAVAEVLVDRFTGELRVPRVDLLIDIGRSINPGIDRGQVIGGFIQGMGWVTTEALVYDAKGDLLSHSPTTYKIPAITDVPAVFNIATFDNNDNVRNVYRSKAVGEPPLMLGIAVWAAAKDAIASQSLAAAAELLLPATGEEMLRCLTIASNEKSAANTAKATNGITVPN
ncbi:MAG TPA: xanthine dehydrogenase molybdopterin binding subunit [Lacipirellulaceae bacterium]|nr:xanthine dehydrogenase molybdopterin binding subunit [Lacipirellulaceae bacterium]